MRLLLSLLLLAALPAFAGNPNTLTEKEQTEGWQLLFDGSSTAGWHTFGGTDVSTSGWVAEDGQLKLKKKDGKSTAHKDIVTEKEFTDFELVWEWNIAEGGNSGVKYNLPDKKAGVGCEYQMIDDERHPDAKRGEGKHTTASLYDLIAPAPEVKMNPAGQWNESRVVVKGNHVEQFLNGKKTVEFDFGSDSLKGLIAQSKFKSTKGWGEKISSPLLLQDHGDEVSVRNMKIRVLTP